ncbi:hypothetical protein RvY_01660 [Ramazzottius varieornatus]|uniref:Uncharacterized protein n=1 Tax=Ramazzottius varieornatus TaxID=947166 RepID=A0A1D1UKY4_RAMVA|nr:hypothetical protein RvY_01660 [Ramazzottius varieornatus]
MERLSRVATCSSADTHLGNGAERIPGLSISGPKLMWKSVVFPAVPYIVVLFPPVCRKETASAKAAGFKSTMESVTGARRHSRGTRVHGIQQTAAYCSGKRVSIEEDLNPKETTKDGIRSTGSNH